MDYAKPYYNSKRIIGATIGLFGIIAMFFGLDFDKGQATEQVTNLMISVGWIINFYGSIVAKAKIKLSK